MLGRRTRSAVTVILIVILCGVSAVWLAESFATPPVSKPSYRHPQWIEMQIVTAPVLPSQNRWNYDEARTIVHSTHRILIDASGNGAKFYAVSAEIPIEVSYSSAVPNESGDGILLRDLEIYLPVRFRNNPRMAHSDIGFTTHDTIVTTDYHAFRRDMSIPHSTTFLRMRHAGELSELATIDLPETVQPE